MFEPGVGGHAAGGPERVQQHAEPAHVLGLGFGAVPPAHVRGVRRRLAAALRPLLAPHQHLLRPPALRTARRSV